MIKIVLQIELNYEWQGQIYEINITKNKYNSFF